MYVTHVRKISEEEERLVSKDIVKKEVTNYQEIHWREKVKEIELSARTANRHR